LWQQKEEILRKKIKNNTSQLKYRTYIYSLACSQLPIGFIGVLSANLFRFFVGNTFMVAALLLGLYGGLFSFKRNRLHLKTKE